MVQCCVNDIVWRASKLPKALQLPLAILITGENRVPILGVSRCQEWKRIVSLSMFPPTPMWIQKFPKHSKTRTWCHPPKEWQPVVVILPVLARTGIKLEPGTSRWSPKSLKSRLRIVPKGRCEWINYCFVWSGGNPSQSNPSHEKSWKWASLIIKISHWAVGEEREIRQPGYPGSIWHMLT